MICDTLPKLEKLYLKSCDSSTLKLLCVIRMPALDTLLVDCSNSSPNKTLLAPVRYWQAITSLSSVKYIALYNVPVLADAQGILDSASNATHVALSLGGP